VLLEAMSLAILNELEEITILLDVNPAIISPTSIFKGKLYGSFFSSTLSEKCWFKG
jgi:hypothetical protein